MKNIWAFRLMAIHTASGRRRIRASGGFTIFSLFPENSDYFLPSGKGTMINFMVKDLTGLIAVLREEGVTIAGDPVEEEYGKFGWIIDPDGNKIELWEPPVL